jgi:hypothetical protein
MKNYLIFILLISYCPSAYNQILKGTIQDESTRTSVNFATVYFDGTFVGTHSDQNGYFELDISKYRSMPLTISALGYHTITISGISPDKYYRILLVPKVFELGEVVVKGKAKLKARKEKSVYLKSFRDDFLGTTLNAQKCKIINENDIILKYDAVNDTLKAFCQTPILIENKALGYKISYFLDKFELCKNKNYLFYSGAIFSQEDLMTDASQKERFEKRRITAYYGSRMHFFRTLWLNKLESAGYSVSDTANNKLSYTDIVFQKDSLTKNLRFNGKLVITYHHRKPQTYIIMSKDGVSFDENGYFDAHAIKWDGEMAKYRIADWLPFEYSVKGKEITRKP